MELTACDYRGRKLSGATVFTGTATILDDVAAAAANRVLHRRYGWQWNLVPLIRIPGVKQVHAGLPWREKWRKARWTSEPSRFGGDETASGEPV